MRFLWPSTFVVDRLQALCEWLKDCASAALHKSNSTASLSSSSVSHDVTVPRTDPDHVHCVAAILWHCNSNVLAFDLRALVAQDLLRCVVVVSVLSVS